MTSFRSLLLCVIFTWQVQAGEIITPLNQGWQFRLAQADEQARHRDEFLRWRDAEVPGFVHTDLLRHKLIPDPYAADAESALQWIGLAQWQYRIQFDVSAAAQKQQHHELVFDGIDTFADIYLNEQKIAETSNAFRYWRIPIDAALKSHNELRVVLHSPIKTMLPLVQAMPNKLAGNYPSPFGDEPRDAMTANFVRKPGYHYGWDWGPRYVTAGIWRDVRLHSWSKARLVSANMSTQSLTTQNARMMASITVQSDQATTIPITLSYQLRPSSKAISVSRQLTVEAGEHRYQYAFDISKPQLWYPVGYGDQALYAVRIASEEHAIEKTLGLRTVALDRSKDQNGQAFGFIVNGKSIYAKGANLIPLDSFATRVDTERVRKLLQSARDANMNMLRLWGGGYYETDQFYQMADELGLMIWQDFMFGGGVVPAYDPEFRANVVVEAQQQLQRLSEHPSVVLWCGNNEMETAWKDWGIGKRLAAEAPAFAQTVWSGYQQLFGQDLREAVRDHGNGVPYWSSSPGNDLAEKANDSNNGDKHYWEVWAGSAAMENYLRETPRFMSEFGLQSWPSLALIQPFAQSDQLDVAHPLVKARQKFMAGEGNTRLQHYIDQQYGAPKNFAHFFYLSQQMQADGISLASLHHRASQPFTKGSLYWQLNDVWPGASWSGIDYFGNWKALHYHAKHFNAERVVVAERLDGKTNITLIDDRARSTAANLHIRWFNLDGQLLGQRQLRVQLRAEANKVLQLSDDEWIARHDKTNLIAVLEWRDLGGRLVAKTHLFFSDPRQLSLSPTTPEMTFHKNADGFDLSISSQKVVRGLWLELQGREGHFSDNSLTLMPGEKTQIRLITKASEADIRAALRWQHLASF